MTLAILGGAALVVLCTILLVGRVNRREAEPLDRAELVERMKRLP